VSNRPRPARREPRRYPWTAYIPFALLVTVPLVLIIVSIMMIGRLINSSGQRHPSPTPAVTHPAGPTNRPAATVSVPAGIGHAGTPTAVPLLSVVIATDRDSAGVPVNPATLFRGDHVTLWAFVTLPRVRAHDAIQFVWRDLGRHSVVETWTDTITADATAYRISMYAYVGDAANKPFPLGQYRVDVYRNARLVGSGTFRVAPRV
jgi:hypothetical protein